MSGSGENMPKRSTSRLKMERTSRVTDAIYKTNKSMRTGWIGVSVCEWALHTFGRVCLSATGMDGYYVDYQIQNVGNIT